MAEEHEQLKSRLKTAIGDNSLRKIAQLAGLAEGTLRNILSGGMPKVDNLISIAEACQVQFSWLATGKGEITLPPNNIVSSPSQEYTSSDAAALAAAQDKIIKMQEQLLRLKDIEISQLKEDKERLKNA